MIIIKTKLRFKIIYKRVSGFYIFGAVHIVLFLKRLIVARFLIQKDSGAVKATNKKGIRFTDS
ncbi:MAG: hypothetical protein BGO54_13640 [Sphingobacteriales bacterium 46-32]|nr:MAG: hypothetical protein BGO54_13640 [Sphingobacteriales bacterium 46-32]